MKKRERVFAPVKILRNNIISIYLCIKVAISIIALTKHNYTRKIEFFN